MKTGNILREKPSQVKRRFRDKIARMREIDIRPDELVSALLAISAEENVCLLDSCGVGHLGSHLLFAGIRPVSVEEVREHDPEKVLASLETAAEGPFVAMFTISYDLGRKMIGLDSGPRSAEPDAFIALFDAVIVHDYAAGLTYLTGNEKRFAEIASAVFAARKWSVSPSVLPAEASPDLTMYEYLAAVETIRERIRCGDTYQANLTQQITAKLPPDLAPQDIFARLRRDHPAPFGAFLTRPGSTVVSASPERFFRIDGKARTITTSPIKGTRPRGLGKEADEALRNELIESEKDRAENTMIVDLLRNDIGRICKFGSVKVTKLCGLEEHPTLFHLVSTVEGDLRPGVNFADVLRAMFPCGSITGAPKISTMRIIDAIEGGPRGLSMGSIGYSIPKTGFDLSWGIDVSVAIRTMVIRGRTAEFNVGGGIVIDSDPDSEYEESLVKAAALLTAINARREQITSFRHQT